MRGPAPVKAHARLVRTRGRARSTLHAVESEGKDGRRGAHGVGVRVRREIDEAAQRGGVREGCAKEHLWTEGKGGKREEGRRTHQIALAHSNLQALQPRTPARSFAVVPGAQSTSGIERLEAGTVASAGAGELEDEGTEGRRGGMIGDGGGGGRWPGQEACIEREGPEERGRREWDCIISEGRRGGATPRWSLTGSRARKRIHETLRRKVESDLAKVEEACEARSLREGEVAWTCGLRRRSFCCSTESSGGLLRMQCAVFTAGIEKFYPRKLGREL
ncbi:hypothetical protein FB451DRAFT_1180691 [Mycena latifolia]|nr:hypothetical protein FB451DRAFT_1180691 [Mycena latifolia]